MKKKKKFKFFVVSAFEVIVVVFDVPEIIDETFSLPSNFFTNFF